MEHDPTLVPRTTPELLSVVIPMFNEELVLPRLRERLEMVALRLPCAVEWIFVNDGSRDATGPMLFAWAERDERVRVVDLSRNFGHQAAVTAGLEHAAGEAIVVMDADLQDPPELLIEMLERYSQGYDVVFAQRTKRHGEGLVKRSTAALFYWIMRRFVHRDLPASTGDFRLMSRDVNEALRHLREGQRFLRGMIAWLGFRQTAVQFERPPRAAGETKYPLLKMARFAWDAILSFTSAPVRLASYLGILVIVVGIAMGGYAVGRKLIYDDLVPGWATLVVITCGIGGSVLLCLGLIGEYVARIYEEIKQRPIYVTRRTANLSSEPLPARGVGPTRSVEQPDVVVGVEELRR